MKHLLPACLLIFVTFISPSPARGEHEGKVQILLLGDSTTEGSVPRRLPGWYGDRHPNLAGYNIIAVETAKYLGPLLVARKK